jgi:hypothetical protein
MTYLPSDEDLALIKNHSSNIYCRIDLLNSDFVTIDSLQGVCIDGSISIDSESDIRRTFTTTLYLGKNSNLNSFTETEWLSKNVRVFIGLYGDGTKRNSVDEQVRRSKEYSSASKEYNQKLQNITDAGHAVYGSINNLGRKKFVWNSIRMTKYKDAVEENGIKEGDYSTALGSCCEYSGLEIAYTSIFEDDDYMIPLTQDQAVSYIKGLGSAITSAGNTINVENLYQQDAEGCYVNVPDGKIKIHGMIAAIEGQALNGSKLTKADVGAISGMSLAEIQQTYGSNYTSNYIGFSMHDVQDTVIKAQDVLQSAYDKVAQTKQDIYTKEKSIHWYNQGCYSFSSNGFTYNSTTNTVQATCVDLVARLNGDLAGQLSGVSTRINRGIQIGPVIRTTFELSEFNKCVIDYWSRKVPHTLDYDTGTTIWTILTELRDLYYPFEMYFDDDTFVCQEIPSGFEDPPVLTPELFESIITSDGESATVDYTTVRNCIEVFGATNDADVYCSSVSYDSSSNTLVFKLINNTESSNVSTGEGFSESSDSTISFIAPLTPTGTEINILLTVTTNSTDNGSTTSTTNTYNSKLYQSACDENGNDVIQDPTVMVGGKYYVIKHDVDSKHFLFIGQQQAHAMVKLVSQTPSDSEIETQKEEENCDNLKFICMDDPSNLDDLYNSQMTVEKIGRRNEILSGGDYENYTTDQSAMEVAEYELWKKARLTDGLTVTTLLVPWLDVNEKIEYAARYLNTNTPVEWIIKSISMDLGSGTMGLTLSRYYPYYPYIVTSKYDIYQDWVTEKYFPEIGS